MTDWLDGFEAVTFPQSLGGDFTQSVRGVVWHCTVGWCAQHAFNVYAAAPKGACPHITAEYAGTNGGADTTLFVRKRRVQHVPLNRSSYALERGNADHICNVQTNRSGVIQIERVGFPTDNVSIDEHRWLGEEVLAPILRACPSIPPSVVQGMGRMNETEWANWAGGQARHANVCCQPQGHTDPPELDLDLILHFALELNDRLNEETDEMPDYIIRNGRDDTLPWLAVYPDGKLRHIGGTEAGLLLGGMFPDGHTKLVDKPLPVIDEMDTDAYNRARAQAGA